MEKTPFLNPSDFLEDETFLISFNIALICQRICDVQTKILKKYDLTPRQSLVLAYLRNHPEDKITQKILEDKMHLSNPTVTVIERAYEGLSREDIDYLKSIMRRIMNNLIAEEKK